MARSGFSPPMKSLRAGGAFAAVMCVLAPAILAETGTLSGFKEASSATELESEKAFDAAIDPADMRSWMEQMASEPNQVGSPHDRANADFTLAKFKEWGWDTHIETFSVLYPTPKSEVLELVAPTQAKAKLLEGPIDGDHTSGLPGGLPPYSVFGADGDVTADLIYVNFGMPDDYKDLDRRGLSVKGKIVIARYGAGWRGLKPKIAAEHGAVGCIIYSDPHEDGYWAGDVYPKGGYRPEDGVQRGSVADITDSNGDEPSGGTGAADAPRVNPGDLKTTAKIPVLPISYGDAKVLLAALDGPVAPPSWRGALPFTYHIGPGPAKVHLAVASDWGQKDIYDVIAVMQGSVAPNQWVIRGNHHDGWVFGAWDPLAGNTALMAEAKAIGALAKTGWQPKRTLIYASWDAEEPGLLGSTAWAMTHATELQRKAVLYVNSDTNARGMLSIGGSLEFQHLANEVAGTVTDPETGSSVLDRERAKIRVDAFESPPRDPEDVRRLHAAEAGEDVPLVALGAGSDYTTFLHHLGIASLDIVYRGEGANAGIYHSAYDSFDHFIRFGDPKFAYGVALAQTAGHIMLRTADADIIPMRFSDLSAGIAADAEDIAKVVEDERRNSKVIKKLIADNAFTLAADPAAPVGAPGDEGDVPNIDFSPLTGAVARLNRSARDYDAAFANAASGNFRLPSGEVIELNGILQGMEQGLLDKRGLPGRAWYQNMAYAPGSLAGYGSKTLPAIREAVELRQWDVANAYIPIVVDTLNGVSKRLDAAAHDLVARLGARSAGPTPTPSPPPDS